MGLLTEGSFLSWDQAEKYANHIRKHGITQFLNVWDRQKGRRDPFLWGDEIEYMVISYDHEGKNARLALRQSEILDAFHQLVQDTCANKAMALPNFVPETSAYMIESTPGTPLTGSLNDLLSVENCMRHRRSLLRRLLKSDEALVSLTSFPRLGAGGVFTEPHYEPSTTEPHHSLFIPREVVGPHVRHRAINENITLRRGSKPPINIPVFFDANTPQPFFDPTIPPDLSPIDAESILPDHIYLDSSEGGFGCCCLQVTFQAANVDEAKRVYDALIPVGPIMLALTAASPAYKGHLADVDCRWNVIGDSADDRTQEERSEKSQQIPKSRYAGNYSYISSDFNNRNEHNDSSMPYDEAVYEQLINHGIEEPLATHIARLYIRDPLLVIPETINQDDANSIDHFETIQSTNWQAVRFKIPPPNSPIGWRVEFRTMEVQLTDFENAAFAVFLILLSRAIVKYGVNFYIPISLVDENMERAQKRSAVTEEKFWFRKDVFSASTPPPSQTHTPTHSPSAKKPSLDAPAENTAAVALNAVSPPWSQDSLSSNVSQTQYVEMTVGEIINGKGEVFPGLLGLVNAYVNSMDVDQGEKQKLGKYLDLIKRRGNGSLCTTATWIRNFIRAHPAYANDSVVTEEINYDLITALEQIENATRRANDLLPEEYPEWVSDEASTNPIQSA
ncbi:hypothetical protein BOTBODRAFT_118965 [Botryobasidium botryosum FD-172 SS1]|uniref:Glutamate--cysteine ligase n=1 Tax=Botryobasidium botryosum (strain FD-172 SS1) TaxID=930990 RepID=A0A067M8H1_BOTB1|nr:hypothetical protein BOTBODRAFT_118965 [Botryobasidium botryosum FD-172 SS1]